MASPVLRIRRLAKTFGAQVALRDVSLDVRPGEIHALLGENGAGKSTLIKILAGVYQSDGGDIEVDGRLSFVHQDLGLVDTLSVADNVALETGYAYRGPLISPARTRDRVKTLLARLAVDVRPETLVGELAQDQKVMVAVARALGREATVVVLDEVSASLPAPEMAALSQALRASRSAGVAYLFVTHRIDEVFDLADRVTVLRDGRVRATADVAATTHQQVVEWITGHAFEPHPAPVRVSSDTRCRLAVQELAGNGLSEAVTFEVAAGEVVGICGLIGSGTRALAALLGGDARPACGQVTLDGTPLPLGNSRRLRQAGAMFVPGDRQVAGTVADLTIRENLFLARGRRMARDRALIRPRSERAAAGALATRFAVRPAGSVERPLATLSGGNQQKVVVGRALRTRPRLLVLEDPTAGVDIGSRLELHRLMRAAAAEGTAVVLISTDFEEVAGQSHRALVMAGGRFVAELAGADLDPARLAAASYQAADLALR